MEFNFGQETFKVIINIGVFSLAGIKKKYIIYIYMLNIA